MPILTCHFIATQRWGNAAFIYCFLKAYAEKMNCVLQLPKDWVGRKVLLGANEPVINVSLPSTPIDSESREPVGSWFGKTNIDIAAYCQHQKYLDFYSRRQVMEWLKLKSEFERYAPNQGSYSAAHIRRGDYCTPPLSGLYCEVSDESYDRAIEQFNIPQPVFRVQEGWRAPAPELQKQGLSWLQDFLFLRDAAHLLRANSSFSVFASWLGHGKTYSPVVGDKVGLNHVEFVEGNHENTAGRFPNQSALHIRE